MTKFLLTSAFLALMSQSAVALENEYVLRVENRYGEVSTVGKKDKAICERELEALLVHHTRYWASGECVSMQQVLDEMTEKVRRYSCTIPDGKCWQEGI